jgi:hypothetical protein
MDQISDYQMLWLTSFSDVVCSNDVSSVEERLQELLHKESDSSDAQNLVIKLNDLCQKIHKVVCDHLRPFLEPLILMVFLEKYHINVSLFLDPRFVSLKHLLDLHSHEYRYTQDYKIAYSRPYMVQTKDRLLDYIAAAENTENPIPESICGDSFNMDEMKDLYRDEANFDSHGTQLENIKFAANDGINFMDVAYA